MIKIIDGVLLKEESYISEKEEYEYIVVDSIIPYLEDKVEVTNTTFGQILNIIFREHTEIERIFSSHLGNYSLASYIGESCGPQEINKESGMTSIEIYWTAENWEWGFESYCGIHGKGDETNWGIDFVPLNELMLYPFNLNKEFNVRCFVERQNKVLLESTKEFSIYDIVGTILDEISFYGDPNQRSEQKEELDGILKGIEDGSIETTPWEDLRRDLEEDSETSEES